MDSNTVSQVKATMRKGVGLDNVFKMRHVALTQFI
jgi:hypothetical protein